MKKIPKGSKQKIALFVLWQSLVVKAYRSFFYRLKDVCDWRIALASPDKFKELGSQIVKCEAFEPPFSPKDNKLRYFILKAKTSHTQVVRFKKLGKAFRQFFGKGSRSSEEKRVFLCFAEPYSVTAFLAYLKAKMACSKNFVFICYSFQNLFKRFNFVISIIKKFIFKRVDIILVPGVEQEEVLRKHGYFGKCMYFPLWFDSSIFKQIDRDQAFDFMKKTYSLEDSLKEKIIIGFSGSIVEEKGIFDLMECLATNTRRWSSGCGVLVAGGGDAAGRVAKAAFYLKRKGWNIDYLGALPASHMPYFFSLTDLLVVPSKTAENWKEQFGRIIIEAMACGAVVVGSNSGEIPTVIGDNNRVFIEGDIKDMTAVIDKYIQQLFQKEKRMRLQSESILMAKHRYSDVILAQNFVENLQEKLLCVNQKISDPIDVDTVTKEQAKATLKAKIKVAAEQKIQEKGKPEINE